MKLINKESHLVWSQCIREAAYYYLVQYPNIGKINQSEYQTIGGSMYGQYPLIRRNGPRPWSAFAKDLSSRIRHVRWSENRKSLLPNYETIGDFNPSPAKSLCLAQDTRSPSSKLRKIPEEELEQHLLKLGKLSEDIEQKHLKDERLLRVAKDINILLKETYVNRRELIEAQRESGSVKQITDRYPCFTNPIFVFAELKLIKGKDLWTSAQKNIDCLFDITRSLQKGDGKEGLEADISSFLCMEKESAYDRGKGRKTASILTVYRGSHEDFSPDEVDKAVQKVSNEHSPSLMVFVNDDAITHAIVKADNVNLSSCPTFRNVIGHQT
ncbi:uncharacterized protein LOC124118578 [Haliotis rufescens]|uniref:uncharacterized protein LOC124118578 n=1 Tax=Haliotis rufescens TaxID=6454 RepID=UPI00201F89DF|nr:uncharacterized protein LOC124118578 [Haliotis rufescens]